MTRLCRRDSLPAPAESAVELDQREPFVQLRLRKIELRGEFVVFTGEYLEVTRATVPVEYFREAIGILCRRRQQLLLLAELAALLIRGERARNLLESVHDRLLIGEKHFFLLRFGEAFSRAQGPSCKHRLG